MTCIKMADRSFESKLLNSGKNSTEKSSLRDSEAGGVVRENNGGSSAKKLLIGLLIVLVIACSWVGSTQTAKSSYNSGFSAPYFATWFSTCWMISVFPLTIPLFFISKKIRPNKTGWIELWRHSREVFSPSGVTVRSLLSSTVLFTLLWAGTNYMYSRALMLIPPSDVTALFSTAPAFVFLLSLVILREPPLILRFGAVLLAVSGIVLFAYVDGFESANIIGVLLSVGSALGAALYKVLLKWRVSDASLYQMTLFLSCLGLFSTLFLWPVPLVLHLTGVEVLVNIPWTYLCISSLLGVVFNLSINFGIAYTFPLFISLGTVLGIPLNALVDALVRNVDFFGWKFPATDLIVVGFILMLLPPSDSRAIHRGIVNTLTCSPCRQNSNKSINQSQSSLS